jgi:hypothetical protein
LSSRSGTQSKQNKPKPKQQQAAQQARPRPSAAEAQALAAQDAARKEARLQRQAQARAEAERRQRTQKMRTYSIVAVAVVAVVAIATFFIMREANKPGQSVPIMLERNHLTNATDAHVAYTTDPPTSGPHTQAVPQFKVYTEPIDKELQVHGLEDGGVIVNYKPDLDKPTVDKLASLVGVYNGTPGKENVVMSPYPGLSDPIVLTTWGHIDRLATFDEVRVRRFIDEYVNIDHHEGTEGQRLP